MAVVIPIKRKGYESCVLCRRLTNVPTTRPIDLREHYIEGAGQLCPECYRKLYGPVKEERDE